MIWIQSSRHGRVLKVGFLSNILHLLRIVGRADADILGEICVEGVSVSCIHEVADLTRLRCFISVGVLCF